MIAACSSCSASFDVSTLEVWTPLLNGGCVVLHTGAVDIPDLTNFLNGLFSLDGAVGGACTGGDTTCNYDALEVNFSGGTASG